MVPAVSNRSLPLVEGAHRSHARQAIPREVVQVWAGHRRTDSAASEKEQDGYPNYSADASPAVASQGMPNLKSSHFLRSDKVWRMQRFGLLCKPIHDRVNTTSCSMDDIRCPSQPPAASHTSPTASGREALRFLGLLKGRDGETKAEISHRNITWLARARRRAEGGHEWLSLGQSVRCIEDSDRMKNVNLIDLGSSQRFVFPFRFLSS